MRILEWNVNGIRACAKKGFLEWLKKDSPDILCLQETKARVAQVPKSIAHPEGCHAFWCAGARPGYSGVALLSKKKPKSVRYGFGIKRFDKEGRIIIAEYSDFILMNIYFPNGKSSKERLKYKMDFYAAFLKYADKLRKKGKKLIITGDFNTAHERIDIARPDSNKNKSGFLPKEREWMDEFESHGYVDTYRYFHPKKVEYSYWSLRTNARERNVGWRLDYFYVTKNMVEKVKKAFILTKIKGSDHCPVGIELKL